MSKIYVFSEKENIIEEAANLILEEKTKDFSKILVIFPGKRPASYLNYYIAKKLNFNFFPPKVLSMNEFIELILINDDKFFAFTKIEDIEAIWLLYEILKEDKFVNFIEKGKRIYKFIEESDYECENIENMKIKEDTIMKEIYEIEAIRKKFHEKLQKEKKWTNGFMYFCARNIIEKISPEKIFKDFDKIYFVGIYGVTESEKQIIKKIIDTKDTFLLLQNFNNTLPEYLIERINFYNIETNLDHLKKQENENKINQHIEIFSVNKGHEQSIKTNEILKILASKNSLKNTCIVVPKVDSLIHLINFLNFGENSNETNNSLSLYNHSLNIGIKYPITKTNYYLLIESLTNCLLNTKEVNGKIFYPFKKYIDIITNPLVNVQTGVSESFAISIDEIKQELKISSINEILSYPFRVLLFKEIVEKVEKILNEILKDKNEKYFKNFDVSIYFFEKFSEIKNYKIANEKFEIKEGLEIILEILKEVEIFSNTKSPADIEILSPLETENLRFRNLMIFDAEEGILPEGRKTQLLFPETVYKNFPKNMPLYIYNDNLYAYYFYKYEFYRLINAAENVYIFYEDREDTQRSRYIERLIFEDEKKNTKSNALTVTTKKLLPHINLMNEKNIVEIKKDETIIKKLNEFVFSPTAIDTFLRDQIAFYYQYMLNIKEREDEEKIKAKEIGKIIHEALYYAYNKFIGIEISSENANEIYTKIYENIEDFFNKELNGRELIGKNSWRYELFKKIARIKLKKFVENENRNVLKEKRKFKILYLEKEITTEYNFNTRKVKFKGRIDRIDKFVDDDIYILIDYKTGSVPKNKKIDIDLIEKIKKEKNKTELIRKYIKSFQMPMYVLLFKNFITNFQNVPFEKIFTKFVDFETDNNLEKYDKEKADEILKILDIIIEEILDPEKPFRTYIE